MPWLLPFEKAKRDVCLDCWQTVKEAAFAGLVLAGYSRVGIIWGRL